MLNICFSARSVPWDCKGLPCKNPWRPTCIAETLHSTTRKYRGRRTHQHVAYTVEPARPQIRPLQAEVAAVGVAQALHTYFVIRCG